MTWSRLKTKYNLQSAVISRDSYYDDYSRKRHIGFLVAVYYDGAIVLSFKNRKNLYRFFRREDAEKILKERIDILRKF